MINVLGVDNLFKTEGIKRVGEIAHKGGLFHCLITIIFFKSFLLISSRWEHYYKRFLLVNVVFKLLVVVIKNKVDFCNSSLKSEFFVNRNLLPSFY